MPSGGDPSIAIDTHGDKTEGNSGETCSLSQHPGPQRSPSTPPGAVGALGGPCPTSPPCTGALGGSSGALQTDFTPRARHCLPAIPWINIPSLPVSPLPALPPHPHPQHPRATALTDGGACPRTIPRKMQGKLLLLPMISAVPRWTQRSPGLGRRWVLKALQDQPLLTTECFSRLSFAEVFSAHQHHCLAAPRSPPWPRTDLCHQLEKPTIYQSRDFYWYKSSSNLICLDQSLPCQFVNLINCGLNKSQDY